MRSHYRPVVFIAFEESENLGTGYLCSILTGNGFETRAIDFRINNFEILKAVKRLDPIVVGFSVIFESYIRKFRELAGLLRRAGIKCHFTAGGQYASLRYKELFDLMPSLDSIVRFDGEYTVLELTKCISSGKDWRNTDGIVYKRNRKIIKAPDRPLEKDLDKYPFPMRFPLKEYALGKKFATILAGRGCIYNCAYCCLREYYRQAPGPSRRVRSPENVVREIELLFKEKECSVFLFQDDDFPVKTNRDSEWIKSFCKELKRKGLHDKIMWKINCRPDEIEDESISLMKNHGLFLVFIGIEDGTNTGLRRLKKHMTTDQCLNGINTLKKHGIGFDFGFMLFQPLSTFVSINENIDFLKLISGDGYTPLIFNKLLPYFGTEAEKELRKEGRLIETANIPDYRFNDESLNRYHDFILECFADWLTDPGGIVNISRWARNYFSVYSRYYCLKPEIFSLHARAHEVIRESNNFILEVLGDLADVFESSKIIGMQSRSLKDYRYLIRTRHNEYGQKINEIISELMQLAQ